MWKFGDWDKSRSKFKFATIDGTMLIEIKIRLPWKKILTFLGGVWIIFKFVVFVLPIITLFGNEWLQVYSYRYGSRVDLKHNYSPLTKPTHWSIKRILPLLPQTCGLYRRGRSSFYDQIEPGGEGDAFGMAGPILLQNVLPICPAYTQRGEEIAVWSSSVVVGWIKE